MEALKEPWEYWDDLCDRQDKEYARIIEGKICEDCLHCVKPGSMFKNPERLGYCEDCGEFISLDDSPEEEGLECFDES